MSRAAVTMIEFFSMALFAARTRATSMEPDLLGRERDEEIGSEGFVSYSVTTPFRADNVIAFINLDMQGCCGDLAASDENFALHQRLKSAAERLGYGLTYAPGVGGSDHFTYLRRRVPAVMISGTDVGPFHTVGDTPATVDPARLRASGQVVLQSVLEMAAS